MKDRKINFGFSYPSNMANFELFHWTINFMAYPKFLRSLMYDEKLKINYQIFILRIFFSNFAIEFFVCSVWELYVQATIVK